MLLYQNKTFDVLCMYLRGRPLVRCRRTIDTRWLIMRKWVTGKEILMCSDQPVGWIAGLLVDWLVQKVHRNADIPEEDLQLFCHNCLTPARQWIVAMETKCEVFDGNCNDRFGKKLLFLWLRLHFCLSSLRVFCLWSVASVWTWEIRKETNN